MAPAHSKIGPLAPKEWLATNYYLKHVTKSDYDKAFGEAREWAVTNPTKAYLVVARIFWIKEDSLR